MKLIPLSERSKSICGLYFAKVDDEDFEYLKHWRWSVQISPNNKMYARRTVFVDGKTIMVSMHRFIFGETNKEVLIDHEDNDGLNNQKYNLRPCNYSQNQANKHVKTNCTSKYLGVSLKIHRYKRIGKDGEIEKVEKPIGWRANILKNGKSIEIGLFDNQEDAARAYDNEAKIIHGIFANLNFK